MEGNMSGSFTQYMQGLNKYSDGTMTIEMSSYKPGFIGIGWSQIGGYKQCRYSGKGNIPEGRCTNTVDAGSTKNVKSVWKQVDQGNMTADIGR